MNFLKTIILVGVMFSVSSCSAYESLNEIQQLNNSQPVGSPFTQKLAIEYRTFANFQLKQDYDYSDALHFARKGLAAVEGITVMPEPISDWDLYADQMQTLGSARGRLINAYEMGAIDQFPEIAAIAQSRFDCWIEAEEEAGSSDKAYIIPCKQQFMDALAQLETRIKQLAPPPVTDPSPLSSAERFPQPVEPLSGYSSEPVSIEDAVYLVFFDWNSSSIGAGADNVIDTITAEIQSRQLNAINVIGHADSSGPRDYNQALGLKRAKAIQQKLINDGIPANMVNVISKGEDELLVQTADNVREPANRRAEIKFE